MQVGNARYLKPGDLPDAIAVFPLPGALLLPAGQLPLNISSRVIWRCWMQRLPETG